ncbi:uncharacterized protein LOC133850676 isoform X3 [Drosophila sulfurigaster albostrigata]|uniref:uncharacterized protein LOC133850676 isoform X3 n=1 Tax=Drosophila sulfurigaster albostrigata TaxID=89887 RepID=UPI002D21DD66|nr:uncharacterized protein LOC133850676 isoform X3 [Drosophila sulfurigaster albostrigata]
MLQQRSRRLRSRQQLERSSCRQVNYLPGLLIVLLVLLQNFELHMCRQLMRRSDPAPTVDDNNSLLKDTDTDTASRRSGREEQRRSVENVGQPEEIFSAPPNDATDMSYDEYPMVVPKRAALLLDRLMVALHHALENEREGHRIGEFYANKNLMQLEPNEYKSGAEKLQPSEEGNNMPSNSHSFHMYSDDDPDVPDYDFKDLNQINRATGETLMAKSFQRRAGGIGVGVGVGLGKDGHGIVGMAMPSSTPAGAAVGAGAGAGAGVGAGAGGRRVHHVGSNGGGRMYWRCYFNAVSCFLSPKSI